MSSQVAMTRFPETDDLDGMYIEYAINGAILDKPTDTGFNTFANGMVKTTPMAGAHQVGRSSSGSMVAAADKLHVFGNAYMPSGFTAYINFIVVVEGPFEPHYENLSVDCINNATPFTVEVPVPRDYQRVLITLVMSGGQKERVEKDGEALRELIISAVLKGSISYFLELSNDKFSLTHENVADFDAKAMKPLEDGTVIEATEAVIVIEKPDPSSLVDFSMTGQPYDKYVILSVNQERGAKAARNDKKTALQFPEDYLLSRQETLRVTLQVGASQISREVRVDISLPRWFPLCFGVKWEWLLSPPDLNRETHLRTNYAAVLKGFQEAIGQYNQDATIPARFNITAVDTTDKARAGLFLFGHSPPQAIGNEFYFTQPEEVDSIKSALKEWKDSGYKSNPPKVPEHTEAALAVKILDAYRNTQKPLSPGEVFGLGLKEARGDIGAAMLLCHNTLRSLARCQGDQERTGVNGLDDPNEKLDPDEKLFPKFFQAIRGGYRVSDGSAGAPKAKVSSDQNFAEDYAGPWYHLFGTAFFEIYTAGKVEKDGSPEEEGWGRMGNSMEQWYREYDPFSRQNPDPEKFCVNLWGIGAADALLRDHPWGSDL